jgi:hypothetical protein
VLVNEIFEFVVVCVTDAFRTTGPVNVWIPVVLTLPPSVMDCVDVKLRLLREPEFPTVDPKVIDPEPVEIDSDALVKL